MAAGEYAPATGRVRLPGNEYCFFSADAPSETPNDAPVAQQNVSAMTALGKALDWLGERASLALMFGLFAGIFLPEIGKQMSGLVVPLVVMLLALAMIRIDFSATLSHIRRPGLLVSSIVLLMVAIPLGVHMVCVLAGVSGDLRLALLLTVTAAPLASSPNLAYLLRLDGALALNVTIIATFLMPAIAPAVLALTLPQAQSIDLWHLAPRLALAVAAAVTIALVVRSIAGAARLTAMGAKFDGAAAILLTIFGFTVTGDVLELMARAPSAMLQLIAIAFALNLGLQVLTDRLLATPMQRLFNASRASALAVAMMAGNRSIALYLAALSPELTRAILPYLAMYQFPIYLTPLIMQAYYRRRLNG